MQETYAVTSVRLPSDLRARFDDLAQVTGRTRTDLIVEAMTRYMEAEMAYIAAVQEGLADVEAGRHRSLEEVTEEWVGRGVLSPTWREDSPEDDG
jgi:predicted transcriptional regulator